MKILIIDDELLIRRSLKRVAQLRGHTAQTASDGKTGVSLWLDFQPHVVFLDVFIPLLDGLGVLEAVRKNHTSSFKAKVIMMSAHWSHNQNVSVLNTIENSDIVDLFIPKPFRDIIGIMKQAESLWNQKSLSPKALSPID